MFILPVSPPCFSAETWFWHTFIWLHVVSHFSFKSVWWGLSLMLLQWRYNLTTFLLPILRKFMPIELIRISIYDFSGVIGDGCLCFLLGWTIWPEISEKFVLIYVVQMKLQATNGSLAEKKKPTVVFVLGKYTFQRLNAFVGASFLPSLWEELPFIFLCYILFWVLSGSWIF